MDLNDKIKQILVDKSISPSHFADEIGVQRSSVSHILAGRNKPSLDIVQKIIRRYPDLGMEWIMDEEELPAIEPDRSEISAVKTNQEKNLPTISSPLESAESKSSERRSLQRNVEAIEKSQEGEKIGTKSIEKILVFFSDGTFKQYTPQ